MLKEFCKPSPLDKDSFVGLHFVDGKPEVVLPYGFSVSDDDKKARRDILKLLSIIEELSDKQLGEESLLQDEKIISEYPLKAYQFVIFDFLRHGYYTEKETQYTESTRGKINWKRTIKKEQPQINDQNIVYLKYVVKTNRINSDNLITQIHEYCVFESFSKLGWLYLDSTIMPKQPRIHFDSKLFKSVLISSINATNNDYKKKLFNCMLDIIMFNDEHISDSSKASFGVQRFEYVWERLVDVIFGTEDQKLYSPNSKWSIKDKGKEATTFNSPLRLDTIIKDEDKYFIIDAKYYRYGITKDLDHLPGTDSIQKQITYGRYLENNKNVDPQLIYNAFILPFEKADSEDPLQLIGIGTADWENYEKDKKPYKYVACILLDTRYAFDKYETIHTNEYLNLCSLIEDSITQRIGTSNNK